MSHNPKGAEVTQGVLSLPPCQQMGQEIKVHALLNSYSPLCTPRSAYLPPRRA